VFRASPTLTRGKCTPFQQSCRTFRNGNNFGLEIAKYRPGRGQEIKEERRLFERCLFQVRIPALHCYFFFGCKTPGCRAKLYVGHFEILHDPPALPNYPDKWFPITTGCPRCNQTHNYAMNEIQTERADQPFHPVGWRPILPPPSPIPQGIN
jgi:hypothetical protein